MGLIDPRTCSVAVRSDVESLVDISPRTSASSMQASSMNRVLPSLALLLAAPIAAADSATPIAYHGESSLVSNGTTLVQQVWSDGIHTRFESTDSDGKKSGGYTDKGKKLLWVYGPAFGCVQIPSPEDAPGGELLASEVIDGHPTQKFKVSLVVTESGKPVTKTGIEWRATDLGNLVIQWTKPDGSHYNLRRIVAGGPEAKALEFPSPPCKYEPPKPSSQFASAPEAPGGFRTVTFSDLSCKKLVPLALTFSLPSEFEIRQGGHMGCFAGRHDDLERLLKVNDQVNFDSLQHGVIWVRTSDSTEYDPQQKHFVSQEGSDDHWASALAQTAGATDVKVIPRQVAGMGSLRVTATVHGKTARMFYLGVGDSPAILISYQSASNGTPADATDWQRFLDSMAIAK
jgi:hypothetical protein